MQNRKSLYFILRNTPRDQLLKVPGGHRNSIWWNIAHVVVIQQLLVYKRSGQDVLIGDEFVQKFGRGTVPDGMATEEEIGQIAAWLFSTVEQTEKDYEKKRFTEYQEYTTSNKVTLSSVEDALAFNIFHEGLHLGVILSLQKALKTSDGS